MSEEKVTFEVGDTVSWCGVEGIVCCGDNDSDYPVNVNFSDLEVECFTKDGRVWDWHKEASLKLVRKAKKKMKIEAWANVYKIGIRYFHTKNDADDYDAATILEANKRIACVKLVSEEFEV